MGGSKVEGREEDEVPEEVKEAEARLQKMSAFKCDDYDLAESDLHREILLSTSSAEFWAEETWSWVLSALIGTIVGIIGEWE